jgi:hypothetical protein
VTPPTARCAAADRAGLAGADVGSSTTARRGVVAWALAAPLALVPWARAHTRDVLAAQAVVRFPTNPEWDWLA